MIGSTNATGLKYSQVNRQIPVTLTASGWSSTAPFTQTVDAAGIRSTDTPIPLLDTTTASTLANEKALKKNFGYLTYYDTEDGKITFTAKYTKPTVDINVVLKGI